MEENNLPQLNEEEVRILGCLIEKSKTTPEYYPLTLNALKTACNQKTARNPVVEYTETTIIENIGSLKSKGLISPVIGGGSRVTKYRHNLGVKYSLDPIDLTILCLLLLRGPLTAGEINSNSGRMHDFDNLEEVNERLNKLAQPPLGFLKMLGRRPGQKENRYIHLLCPFNEEEYNLQQDTPVTGTSPELLVLKEQVDLLTKQLNDLRAEFDALMSELG